MIMKMLFSYSAPFRVLNMIVLSLSSPEIGIDMSQFCTTKRLCCWAALIPGSNESCGKKRAIIAIARMILTAIYQMLSTGEQWNPSDLYKINMPLALVDKQKAKAIKQAKKLLQQEGILPLDEPIASWFDF